MQKSDREIVQKKAFFLTKHANHLSLDLFLLLCLEIVVSQAISHL